MRYKKQRGQKRKLKALLNNINQICPFQNTDYKYEHFHVPCGRFISSPKTSGKIKTAFCKAWLDKTAEIIEQKPCGLPFCKVVAVIDELDFWNSQIIIFYDESYYNSFWLRDSIEQTWNPIVKNGMSFIKKRQIKSNLKEKGYYETINDLDFTNKTILWFYGDIY
ncbi:MAG: DUF3916 domain-containing protein [Ruminiclostridium sp.]|nr:DUF3916 domain-containing protein [Ruminiclostridium sp.]